MHSYCQVDDGFFREILEGEYSFCVKGRAETRTHRHTYLINIDSMTKTGE